jgi:hypothetical protein
MPAIGDFFVKLGKQEPLTPGELDFLRLEMNRIQAAGSAVGAWLGGGGPSSLPPDVFLNSPRGFTMLPHESGGLARDSNLSIPADTHTIVTFEADADVTTIGGLPYSQGVTTDYTTGKITIAAGRNTGGTKGVWLFAGFVSWGIDADGFRALYLAIDSNPGYPMATIPAASGGGTVVPFAYVRSDIQAGDVYYLQVWQNSGAALDITSAAFTATRLR